MLAAVERRYSRQRLILSIAVVLLLLSTTYFAWHFFQEPVKVVSLSRPEAETPAGIAGAAETGHTPLRAEQAGEIAAKIKAVREQGEFPTKTLAVSGAEVRTEVARLADKSKSDFTILTPKDGKFPAKLEGERKVSLDVYNIRAYPRTLIGIGVSRTGTDLSWLRRFDVGKLPLLLPKGGVGYIGPYIRTEHGRSGPDYGVRLMIPM